MKKTSKIIAIVIFLLTICSCQDFLEETPRDEISVNQFFTQPDDVRSAVNQLYGAGALTRYVSGDFQINQALGGYLSGLFTNERTERIGPAEANNLTLNGSNLDAYLFSYWRDVYQTIGRANTAIKYIPQVEELSEGLSTAEANSLMAEARFFRAFNYFALVRDFGDVPLILDPFDSTEGINVPRTASTTVYDAIVEDLKWALDNGGLVDITFPNNEFRITRGVVATTLANVEMQRAGFPVNVGVEAYQRAASAARVVINSGQYALIPNGDTSESSAFNVLRTSENTSEHVFSIELDAQFKQSPYVSWSSSRSGNFPGTTVDPYLAYLPDAQYVSFYDPTDDLRIQNRQLWYTSIDIDGTEFPFPNGIYGPYTWFDEIPLFETGRGGKNLNVNLFSEVLLIAAESIARSEGVTAEAVGYLADVRSRASITLTRDLIVTQLSTLSADAFVEEVWKERLRELPLLFKIWPDIQRTRLFPVSTSAGEVDFVNVVGHTSPLGATFQDIHLLLPIAVTVKQRNPEITGNGY